MPVAEVLNKKEATRWITDPFYWACKFLGKDFDPWSGQRALWDAYGKLLNAKLKRYQLNIALKEGTLDPPNVEAHMTLEEREYADKMGISISSGHGLGKERSMVGIMLHFMLVLQEFKPKGVCTAPAGPTLHSTLWPEFTKVISSSEILSSLFVKQEKKIYLADDPNCGSAVKIEPRTIQQNSNPEEQGVVLQGIHAIGVFFGITEAAGVPEPVFVPIEGGLSDPLSMILMIYNPTKRTGFVADTHTKNRKYWICLQWDARVLKREKLANPGRFTWFNERAQDALIEKYGEDSDTVRVRVIGLPPRQASDTLIHYDSVIAAMERQIVLNEHDPLCIGVDVGGGGSGGDPSVIAVMRGPKLVELQVHEEVDEFRLADLVAQVLKTEQANLAGGASYAVLVDYGGLGRSTYKMLQEKHGVRNLYGIDSAESPIRESEFHRMRDELWWELREGFMESKEIVFENSPELRHKIQNVDDLISQLTSIKWGAVELNGRTRTKVQGKGSSSGIPNVKPLLHSPNEADALCLAWRGYKHYCSSVPLQFRSSGGYSRCRIASWKTL